MRWKFLARPHAGIELSECQPGVAGAVGAASAIVGHRGQPVEPAHAGGRVVVARAEVDDGLVERLRLDILAAIDVQRADAGDGIDLAVVIAARPRFHESAPEHLGRSFMLMRGPVGVSQLIECLRFAMLVSQCCRQFASLKQQWNGQIRTPLLLRLQC